MLNEEVSVSTSIDKTKPSGSSLNRLNHSSTPHGNYHNYYFHRTPTIPDIRLSILDSNHSNLFKQKKVLDLGCNAGKISIESLVYLKAAEVKGIDIDNYLIEQAEKISKEELSEDSLLATRISFHAQDFMKEGYFEDSTNATGSQGSYDTILLLSITKWLHLNHGDSGLKSLFKSLFNYLPSSGGTLILEPQEWENYKKAVNKNKDLRPIFKTIEMRPPFLEELREVGFRLEANIERVEGGFSRPLMIWKKDDVALGR